MNILANENLVERLAAEYVLGTLRGAARRRLQGMMRDSAMLRRAVAEWEGRLNPMAEFARSVRPSAKVWDGISSQLDLKRHQKANSATRGSLLDSLAFWRTLGTVSTAFAALLVFALVIKQPGTEVPAATYVAMLTDDKAQSVALVSASDGEAKLTVKLLTKQQVASDKSLELWAVPKEGAPRSLGLLAADGSLKLPFPADMKPENVPLLAVSVEPKGGSPNPSGPTGPIIFKGAWLRV